MVTEAERIATLEQRVLELETEVVGLAAIVLATAADGAKSAATWAMVFEKLRTRWPDLGHGEIERTAEELTQPLPLSRRKRA